MGPQISVSEFDMGPQVSDRWICCLLVIPMSSEILRLLPPPSEPVPVSLSSFSSPPPPRVHRRRHSIGAPPPPVSSTAVVAAFLEVISISDHGLGEGSKGLHGLSGRWRRRWCRSSHLLNAVGGMNLHLYSGARPSPRRGFNMVRNLPSVSSFPTRRIIATFFIFVVVRSKHSDLSSLDCSSIS